MHLPVSKQQLLARLRSEILRMEGYTAPKGAGGEAFGLGAIEAAFPNACLPLHALHEVCCFEPEEGAAAGGFLAGLLSVLMQSGAAVLWIGAGRTLFPPALKAFGVAPERVVFINLQHPRDVAWAAEEALKCSGLAAVVAEAGTISPVAARRLQLAAEQGGVTGFILRTDARQPGLRTCAARWQISPQPSRPEEGLPGIGWPCWQVELLKVRNGSPGRWQVEWQAGSFRVITQEQAVVSLPQRRAV